MLNDQENARLVELLSKTDKTPQEESELAGLKARHIADENAKPVEVAPLPTQSLPGTMDDAKHAIMLMRDEFAKRMDEQRKQLLDKIAEQASVIQAFKDAQDAIASGKVKVLYRHCNTCGRKLRQGEEACPKHPNEHVNEVGLNPANGVMMLVNQVKGSGKVPPPKERTVPVELTPDEHDRLRELLGTKS